MTRARNRGLLFAVQNSLFASLKQRFKSLDERTFAAIDSRLKSVSGVTVFQVKHLAGLLGITPERINDAITQRPSLFPPGIGIEGRGCRREWTYDDALQVALQILNFSPKAKLNLGLACFAF